MKLEMESVRVEAIQQGSGTYAENGVLQVDFQELEELILRGRRISAVDLSLAFPGDSVRIVNLIDIIQPRCKIEPVGADFPGWIGKMQIAGKGKTRSLTGVTVLVSNPNPADKVWKAVLDMSGVLAELSRFGKMQHVSISPHPAEGVDGLDFENAAKTTGLKTAVYLAKAAEGHLPDDTMVYDLDIPIPESNGSLPRVAYYYQLYTPQHDQGGIPDKIFYGGDVINLMPGIIHPPMRCWTGGSWVLTQGRPGNTYSIQNHGIIKELYRRHGKDLIFAGVVYGVADLDPDNALAEGHDRVQFDQERPSRRRRNRQQDTRWHAPCGYGPRG